MLCELEVFIECSLEYGKPICPTNRLCLDSKFGESRVLTAALRVVSVLCLDSKFGESRVACACSEASRVLCLDSKFGESRVDTA